MVARVVFDQTVATWQRLHAEAFAELGGVPKVVVPDNLKAAVIRAAFSVDGATALNRSYRELARHYGCTIDPTPVRAPQKKGKVESAVKYVKGNFFKHRQRAEIDEVRTDLARWVHQIAGMRVHGTTHRRPLEVFTDEEAATLLPLPARAFEAVVWKPAKVHQDSHVLFEKRLYSVPWRHIGQQVWVRATDTTVAIYGEDVRIATHSRRGSGLRSTLDAHLPEYRADLRHRSRAYWEQRADAMGEQVGHYIREVFAADDVLSMLRTVQAIVTHLEHFPRERAQAACERASYFGNHTYRGVKAILRKGLDLEPLPTAIVPTTNRLSSPRYARRAQDLLQLTPEVPHELN